MDKSKNEATKRASLLKKYQMLFSTPDGREVLGDILKSCGFHKVSFDENPHVMSFNEGQRSIAVRLMQTLKINVIEYEKMLNQAYTGE